MTVGDPPKTLVLCYNSSAMTARTNDEWLRDLRSQGQAQNGAIADLRAFLLRAAYYSLYHQRNSLAQMDRASIEQLAEEAVQEALVAIIKHLDEFRSESKFTTWAYRFAVNFALVAARRERWKHVSLDEYLDGALPAELREDRSSVDPHRAAMQSEARTVIREIIDHALTEKQRLALEAIAFADVPLDEVARRMGSNRNATYKLLHDARRKLKGELEARGYALQDVLEWFSVPG